MLFCAFSVTNSKNGRILKYKQKIALCLSQSPCLPILSLLDQKNSNINRHLALDSILADCHHGFQSQRSCETQFVHDIISNLDGAVNRGHKQTDLFIIDFAKAFDKVPHRRLLHKLDY